MQALFLGVATAQALTAQTRRPSWVVFRSTPDVSVQIDSALTRGDQDGIYRVHLQYTYLSDSLRPRLGRLDGTPVPLVASSTSEAEVSCATDQWRGRRTEYFDSLAKQIWSDPSHDGWRSVQSGEPLYDTIRPLCAYLARARMWETGTSPSRPAA